MSSEEKIILAKEVEDFDNKIYNLYLSKGKDFVLKGLIGQLKSQNNNKNKLFKYILFDLQQNDIRIEQFSQEVIEKYLDIVISKYTKTDTNNTSDHTQIFSTLDAKKIFKSQENDSSLKKEESLGNNYTEEQKEKLLIAASISTYDKYNELLSKNGEKLGTKQLRQAILDKENNFGYFTNSGTKKLRELMRENIKVSEVPVLVKQILLRNGFKVNDSNEAMCCEMFINLIYNYSEQIKKKLEENKLKVDHR